MKTLVFIHGFASGSYIFRPIIDTLATHYNIINISLPGHEQEQNMKADIDVWCEYYLPMVPHNSTIIAWSLGGLLALKIANTIAVSKFILLATNPQFIKTNAWQHGIKYQNFIAFKDSLKNDKERALLQFMTMQGVDKHTLSSLRTQISQNLPTLTGIVNALKVLHNTSAIEEYIKFSDKIVVVLGEKDYIVPISLSDWLQKHNIQTHTYSSGHMPFFHQKFDLESLLKA